MSNENSPRTFRLLNGPTSDSSGVLKIQVNNVEVSVITEKNGMNQVIVYSNSGDQIVQKYIDDFNELVSFFWSVERFTEDA